MSLTPDPDDSEKAPDAPNGSGKSFLPGLNRTRAMGSSGLAAASAGWVLVGCIAFGFGVGTWLDGKFGTTYWMPILVLVGVAAGFRELFLTVAQVSKTTSSTFNSTSKPKVQTSSDQKGRAREVVAEVPIETERKRLLEVPAPPTASFDRSAPATKNAVRTPSRQEVRDALLGHDEPDQKQDKPQ